jgi:hypothetical protein
MSNGDANSAKSQTIKQTRREVTFKNKSRVKPKSLSTTVMGMVPEWEAQCANATHHEGTATKSAKSQPNHQSPRPALHAQSRIKLNCQNFDRWCFPGKTTGIHKDDVAGKGKTACEIPLKWQEIGVARVDA